ncbi:nucleotide sugar dehydrogenase [Streptomyces zhihengii]|uniref:nucleotide sugar dehydrogenase n=1 Tax=Streptomyces zhihengii TaxID=1818004 RepID=UPI0033A8F316
MDAIVTAAEAACEDLSVPPQGTAARTGTVAVVGLGYVGLPTALALRAAGAAVTGIDISGSRLADIRRGDVDLPPEQLRSLAEALRDPEFRLTEDTGAVGRAEAVIVCVPTPVDRHRVPDLRALSAACATVVRHASEGQVLVLTSTSYVGTTRDLLVEPLAARGLRPGTDVYVAFAPERIDPGTEGHAPESTPRVIGGVGRRSTELAAELLRRTAPSIHRVDDPETAEMCKLWENTFRAVNIALANELADTSLEFGLDPRQVIDAAATKPYGFMPFYPGPGVGGHCIPCDPHYLLWQLRSRQREAPLVDSAMSAIAARPSAVVRRAREALADRAVAVAGARILVVGVAYKPGVADVRESPALEIIDRLSALGARVGYHDPLVPEVTSRAGGRRHLAEAASLPWDLVLVHTLHEGTDVAGLARGCPVLDTTHSLAGRPAGAAR